MQTSRSELKTGKRPQNQQLRSYKDGDVLFTEGSKGRELFIVHEGKVGIYKEGIEGKIELAEIEKGGIIGEMSLLDALPRSATAIAKGSVTVLIINYAQFQTIMQSVPVWLQSIIKIVVSRLRDTNRRVDQPVLRDKQRSIISLLFLLQSVESGVVDGKRVLSYTTVVNEACFISRLKRKDVTAVLEGLKKRQLVQDVSDGEIHYIYVYDNEVLRLYEEYLVLKSQKKQFIECTITQETIGILSNIAYVAQKRGIDTNEGTLLSKKVLIEDLNEHSAAELEKHLADLSRRGLLTVTPSGDGHIIMFRRETLSRIKRIKEWMPRFEMEVQ